MTLYVQESVVVWHTATTDDDPPRPITDADVVAVWISIYGPDNALVLDETPMIWVSQRSRWETLWDTTALVAGSYRVRCRVEGLVGTSDWEYARVHLRRNPVEV